MKPYITLLLLLFFGLFSALAQVSFEPIDSGTYTFNPENIACLSESQRENIKQELQLKVENLRRQDQLAFNSSNRGNHPLFIWPVQKASGVDYNEIWGISNYLDHNASGPNLLSDYNCGTRTYDTTSGYDHQGLDIFSWPFGWRMMDNDEAEIIAAAAGQIIAKNDGEFDRSCDFSTTTPWNAVYIQHNDGSVAWYSTRRLNSS